MIVSLFYVVLNLLGLSFLEKGGKTLLLRPFYICTSVQYIVIITAKKSIDNCKHE